MDNHRKNRYLACIPLEAVNQEQLTKDTYDIEHDIIDKEHDEEHPSYRAENTIITNLSVFKVIERETGIDFEPVCLRCKFQLDQTESTA